MNNKPKIMIPNSQSKREAFDGVLAALNDFPDVDVTYCNYAPFQVLSLRYEAAVILFDANPETAALLDRVIDGIKWSDEHVKNFWVLEAGFRSNKFGGRHVYYRLTNFYAESVRRRNTLIHGLDLLRDLFHKAKQELTYGTSETVAIVNHNKPNEH